MTHIHQKILSECRFTCSYLEEIRKYIIGLKAFEQKDIIYSGTKALKDYDKLFAHAVQRNKGFGNNSEQ